MGDRHPTTCPDCGADLTVIGSVTEVYEMYSNECFVDTQGEVQRGGDDETVGEAVRAFCSACSYYLYDHGGVQDPPKEATT